MKYTIEDLESRLNEIASKLHEDETGDESLEDLHAGYVTVIEDLKRDRTDEWIEDLDQDNYKVRVLFSRAGDLYYVSTGLMALQLGWLTKETFKEGSELYEEFKDHPMKSGVGYDDGSYFRGVMDFRWWKVKSNSQEEYLPLTDPLVKDYIDAAIGSGWRPETRDNLRDDQNKDIVQLDYMIRSTYGEGEEG